MRNLNTQYTVYINYLVSSCSPPHKIFVLVLGQLDVVNHILFVYLAAARHTILAANAVRAIRAILAISAAHAALTIRAVLAISAAHAARAIRAISAVLAARAVCAANAARAIRAVRAVLAVC